MGHNQKSCLFHLVQLNEDRLSDHRQTTDLSCQHKTSDGGSVK